jgi:hypothetical protein
MFAELITRYAPALIATVFLVLPTVFLAAMLFEGAGNERWGKIRRATRKTFVSRPLHLPVHRASSIGVGWLDFRRVSAAPREHE